MSDPAPRQSDTAHQARQTDQTDQAAPAQQPAPLNPFPDHRDLYLLIVGVIIGVLLSGAVLGNLAPSAYRQIFIGGETMHQRIIEMRQQHDAALNALESSGVTDVAVQEKREQFERELIPLQGAWQQARTDHLRRLSGLGSALVVALGVMMVLEVLVSPQPTPGQRIAVSNALNRLISIRYALLALWGALVIARPAVLGNLSLVFAAALIAVALLVAFVPLGRRAERPNG